MASNGKTQRGGFGVGVVVGLLVGLVLALGVALYVTKAPIPFMDKVPQRTAEQDAAEIEKNRHWDPNSPLHGKNPARPARSGAHRQRQRHCGRSPGACGQCRRECGRCRGSGAQCTGACGQCSGCARIGDSRHGGECVSQTGG